VRSAWRKSLVRHLESDQRRVAQAPRVTPSGIWYKPEIFNTDQGSQFTSAAFTGLLLENGVAISMDGRGSWRDNVFVERLWRSVKYEEVCLRGL